MIPTSFHIQMLTPLATLEREEAMSVTVSVENGMLTILPGHAALVGSIDVSPVIIKQLHREERFMLRNGIIWVQADGKIVIKALSLEKYEELDEVRIKEYVDMILAKIQDGENLAGFHLEFLEQEKLMLDRQLQVMKA